MSQGGEKGPGKKVGMATWKPQNEAGNHHFPTCPHPPTPPLNTPHPAFQGRNIRREKTEEVNGECVEHCIVYKMLSQPSHHSILKLPCSVRERENTTAQFRDEVPGPRGWLEFRSKPPEPNPVIFLFIVPLLCLYMNDDIGVCVGGVWAFTE